MSPYGADRTIRRHSRLSAIEPKQTKVDFVPGTVCALMTRSGPPPPKCLIGVPISRPVMPTKSPHFKWNDLMKKNLLIAGLFLVTLAMPLAAQAQGVPGGAAHGFNEGNRIAGPVGAVVGTAVGGVIGGVEGVLGVDHRYYVSDSPERPVVYRHHWRHRHHRRHM